MWIGCEDIDFVLYDDATSAYHSEHIVLHELGHVLLGHGRRGPGAKDIEHLRSFFPRIDPGTVCHVLNRGGFDDRQEQEAELFASLVMLRKRSDKSPSSRLATTFAC
jgi:Zn-dependent peptidase ImmA (M78 family)